MNCRIDATKEIISSTAGRPDIFERPNKKKGKNKEERNLDALYSK